MEATGEKYTVARSALVAPTAATTPPSEASESQGGTMSSVEIGVRDELDERGFAVIRSFATQEQIESMAALVDEVIATTVAEKQERARELEAAGEKRINVWHPGEAGVIFKVVTDRPEVQWLLNHARLLEVVATVKGAASPLQKVGALASLPGFGHQGFHPDHEGPSPAIGSWDRMVFVVVLSPYRAATGTIRALPGSHRIAPDMTGWGSAMPPREDEVRIDADPGDVFVYSGHLWKSATFNGGHEPLKSLLVAGPDDVRWS